MPGSDKARIFQNKESIAVVEGLLRIVEIALPDTFQVTDSRVIAARKFLHHEQKPCGRSEPEITDPDKLSANDGKTRTMFCEGGRLVSRGNGSDGHTNGSMFVYSRECPDCAERPLFVYTLSQDLGDSD